MRNILKKKFLQPEALREITVENLKVQTLNPHLSGSSTQSIIFVPDGAIASIPFH
jgi:hypothetical protein